MSTAPNASTRGGGPTRSANTVTSSTTTIVLRPPRTRSCTSPPSSSGPSPSRSPLSSTSRLSPARSPSRTTKRTPCSPSSSARAARASSAGSGVSTKTSISPPHGSPTPNATSSVIPYSSRCGGAPPSTSWPTPKTSFSTHPPETEPASSPPDEISSLAPTGRGAERRVSTTVARATRWPPAANRSSSDAISRTPGSYPWPPRLPYGGDGRTGDPPADPEAPRAQAAPQAAVEGLPPRLADRRDRAGAGRDGAQHPARPGPRASC